MELTRKLKKEYLDLWNSCVITTRFKPDLAREVTIITANQPRYIKVAEETGVPWYVIAIIHSMEASFDFKTHLHNGDSLKARTVQVPAGRPRQGNPPFIWEKSAIDALNFDGATGIKSWDLPTTFWFLESYNGWGHRTGAGRATTPANRSPYIYSGTTHYDRGKYGADGIFDPSLVSGQVGCMAQLFGLVEAGLVNLDSSILQTVKNDPRKVGTVADWQNILNFCGYTPKLLITDVLDQVTQQTTKKLQEDLNITVKLSEVGTVTLETWQAGLIKLESSIVGSVAAWQNILNGCGYIPTLSITGQLDDATTKMTEKFQRDLTLPVTEIVTLETWQAGLKHKKISGWSNITPPISPKINPVLSSTKSDVGTVKDWQHVLNGCGYRPLLTLNGAMNVATVDVTKKFQANLKLSVTGTVTQETWDAGVNHKKLSGWQPLSDQLADDSTITPTLDEFYSDRNNYEAVYDNVMDWFGTTANACVAFLSTALRLSGALDVPMTSNAIGHISLFTLAFSDFLEKDKGWARFDDSSSLEAGDIVFTKVGEDDPAPEENVPAHTYMFAGWSDQGSNVAWVIDNQGFTHERNILEGGGGFNFTPFEYFLRG